MDNSTSNLDLSSNNATTTNTMAKKDADKKQGATAKTWLSTCCWAHFKSELTSPSFFGVQDHSPDGVWKVLDLDQSFCTGEYSGSLLWSTVKLFLWGIIISTFILGWIQSEWVEVGYPGWFMAYVSNWTSLYACIYMTLSLVLSFLKRPSIYLIRATWLSYTIAAVHGLMIVLLYWPSRNRPGESYAPLTYAVVMSHGIICLLVIVDGLLINHVPVRLKHYMFVAAFGLLYFFWTILHAVMRIETPVETLYGFVDWKNAPVRAILYSVGVIFFVFPTSTLLFWGLSLFQRYYMSELDETKRLDEEEQEQLGTTTQEDDGQQISTEDDDSSLSQGTGPDVDIELCC